MEQWHQCKQKGGDALLLFRLGDFYEAFYDDAAILASELELTLTARQGIPMSGIPAVTLDSYLDKLVKRGFLVAIAEQVEKAGETKGLVKREIVRIVSLATHITSTQSSEKANHFFACITRVNTTYGLSLIDLHTGEMIVSEFDTFPLLLSELHKVAPTELLMSKKFHSTHTLDFKGRVNIKEEWYFDHQIATDKLRSHFSVHSLDAFGLSAMVSAINASGSLIRYLSDDLALSLSHIRKIRPESYSSYMGIDPSTIKHLDLEGLQEHLDFTSTPMGARLLKQWVFHPLLNREEIEKRQEAISFFVERTNFPRLTKVRDLERLVMRIKTGHIQPKDLLSLSISLREIPPIAKELDGVAPSLLQSIRNGLIDLQEVSETIEIALVEDPPHRLSDGNVFRKGFSEELDEIRFLRQNSQEWLANYQMSLRDELDIKTLKVSYTKAFGYYIEVSRGQSNKVPNLFERKQTLVNQERYTTPELREYERKILHAEVLMQDLEGKLFESLVQEVGLHTDSIQKIASAIGELDALLSLSSSAKKYGWVCPRFTSKDVIEIIEGRHPIVESVSPSNTFIPNDTTLGEEARLILLTGPNMAGKSTFIRQVAILVILAQMGSFVPAKEMTLGIVDKVFSRIGASDDLSKGQSTFMVEMTETANILHNATSQSLVILDEIGRGTSTYDGISIAWAVAEYLLRAECSPKTLFATHYTELTELEKHKKGIKNYRVAVHESEEGIVFLHKIIPGGADKSYGIHVAKLAGLPKEVLSKAKLVMADLEAMPQKKKPKEKQLTLFADDPKEEEIIQALASLNLDELTPMQALLTIAEWKKRL